MTRKEPVALFAAAAVVVGLALQWALPEATIPEEALVLLVAGIALIARRYVLPTSKLDDVDALDEARRAVRARRAGTGALGLVVFALLGGAAACMPPVPLDSAEALRAERAAGAAEAHQAAAACLADAQLAAERDVLTCIFGAGAIAAAPDRSPSRANQLRDEATGAATGILGALGRRGAAEIEGR